MKFDIDDISEKYANHKTRRTYRERITDELAKETQNVANNFFRLGYAQALAAVLYLIDDGRGRSADEIKEYIFELIKEDKTIVDYVHDFKKDFDLNL